MQIIKLALLSFVFFFLLLTAISLFIPSRIRISKAVNLSVSPAKIISYIKDTAKWKEWHPLLQKTAQQQKQAIQVKQLERTDSSILFQIQYNTQTPILNGWQVYQFPSADSITLQWYMDFRLNWYPWEKFGSLFYENTYGTLMQQGLENMKPIIQATK